MPLHEKVRPQGRSYRMLVRLPVVRVGAPRRPTGTGDGRRTGPRRPRGRGFGGGAIAGVCTERRIDECQARQGRCGRPVDCLPGIPVLGRGRQDFARALRSPGISSSNAPARPAPPAPRPPPRGPGIPQARLRRACGRRTATRCDPCAPTGTARDRRPAGSGRPAARIPDSPAACRGLLSPPRIP